jgi:glucose-1-phosphate cytidylyltransferase
MKVVILCGGYGTRIRDVTESLPKPMINIGPFPILWHIMQYYTSFGHKDFVLCLGYKSSTIKDFFLNFKAHTSDVTLDLNKPEKTIYHGAQQNLDCRVTLAETGLNAMTGARVKKIAKYVADDDTFMLTYGDGVGDVDLNKLLQFHRSHGKILTVTGVRPPGRFGELCADEKGVVTEFNEKPQTTGGRISGGFFVCNRKIFDYLPDDDALVFEQDPMRRLVKDGQMHVFNHDGFWQPMDTYREYSLLNDLYSRGEAPWIR